MKTVKAVFLSMSLVGSLTTEAADPVWEWAKVINSTGEDSGSGVAVDSLGTIYFSGYVSGTAQAGSTTINPNSYFWTILGSDGAIQKARSGVVGGWFAAPSLRATQPSGVVTVATFNGSLSSPALGTAGGPNGTLMMASFDSQLATRWAKTIANGAIAPSIPDVTPFGEIGVVNSFSSAASDGISLASINGSVDALVAKSSSAGQVNWMKRAGGVDADSATSCSFDSAANLYVAGAFKSPTLALGTLTANGSSGSWNAGMLAKVAPDGSPLWLKSFASSSGVGIGLSSVRISPNGEVIVAGVTNTDNNWPWALSPSTTGFLKRMNADGVLVATKGIGSLAVQDLAIDSSGNIYAVGNFRGTLTIDGKSFASKGDLDIFAGKFNSAGTLIWGKTAGGIFADYAGQIALGQDGAVYVAGTIRENASFDSLFFDGKGGGDAFVAKISASVSSQLPIISTQPTNAISYFGGETGILVATTSSIPVTYQWFRDGQKITGATSATFAISSVRPSDDANYYVEVTNQYGTVRSDSVHLIVRGDAPVAVTTLAGTNTPGLQDSTNPKEVRFNGPNSPAIQNDGVIVIPDGGNHAIRLMEPNGAVGTLAGKGTAGLTNGPASVAYFNVPIAAAINSAWDIFVADGFNNVIRKISGFGVREVTTYAGTGEKAFQNGPAAEAKFSFPNDLVCDPDGNLFVTEFEGHRVRKITPDGMVSTYAGTGVAGYKDGPALQAMFNQPGGIARDMAGNLYVTEWGNHTIRKISPAGEVTTIAGTVGQSGFVDGPALTTARLNVPDGIAVDNKGNIFFTEGGNSSVRRIDALGDVLTLVGTAGAGFKDGGRMDAQMNQPGGVAVHPDGSLIVADTYNHAMRRVVWQTNAAPTEAVVLIEVNPSITIFGVAGKTYRVESTESLVGQDWTVLGEVTLASPVETWFDTQPLTRTRRFYRAVLKN